MKCFLLFFICCTGAYSIAVAGDKRIQWPATSGIPAGDQSIDSSGKKHVKQPVTNETTAELKVPVWVDLNAGVSSLKFSGSSSFSFMLKEKLVFTATAFATGSGDMSKLFQTESWTDLTDYGITAGKVISNKPGKLMVTVAAGISYTEIVYHTLIGSGGFFGSEFDKKNVNTIGFPVELKLYMPLQTALGFNVNVQARLNKEKSIFAVTAGIRIGRIKGR